MRKHVVVAAMVAALAGTLSPNESDAISCCRSIERVARDTGRSVGRTAGNVVRETGKAGHNVVKETGKGAEQTAQAIGKAHDDVVREAGVAIDNTGKEIKRAGKNLEELGSGIKHYVESYYSDTRRMLSAAEERLREGKFADAFWHAAYDPWKDTEGRAAKLAQESSLARTAGSVAASAYGGPGGAAAFAAWYAYRATNGDIDAAFKAGLISGATSAGMEYVRGVGLEPAAAGAPVDMSAADMAKRSIMAGAIGGTAVAASGGDTNAAIEGFIRSGGMMLIQDGYRQMGHDLTDNGRLPTEGSVCSLTVPPVVGPPQACSPPRDWYKVDSKGELVKVEGKPVLDMTKVPANYSWVGKAYEAGAADAQTEGGWLMEDVAAKIPGMNGMAVMHDQWVIVNHFNDFENMGTIVPAIVVYYLGTEAGIHDQIAENVVSGSRAAATPATSAASKEPEGDSYLCMKGGGVPEMRYQKPINNKPLKISVGPVKMKVPQPATPAVYEPTGGSQSGPLVSRAIFIAKGETADELACAVIYQKDQEEQVDSAPWYAIHEKEFCGPKARSLVRTHQEDGWYCLSR